MDLNSIDDIKTYLENNNITLEDLADELGVNSDFLKNIFDKKIFIHGFYRYKLCTRSSFTYHKLKIMYV